MKTHLPALLAATLLSGSAPAALIITGIYDGPLPDGDPKGVELYATANISDLSLYGIGSANNGGGSDGVEDTLPPVALGAGQFYYISNNDDGDFAQWFGFAPDFVASSGGVNHNGDDAIELFYDPTGAFTGGESVIDVFGEIDVDGTGTAWDSLDGWAYRNDGVLANGGAFDANNWTFSGANAWDGDDNVGGGTDNGTNATATPPFPTGSWQVPEPSTALLGALSVFLSVLRRRR